MKKTSLIICVFMMWTSCPAQQYQAVSRELATQVAKSYMRTYLSEYNCEGVLNAMTNDNGDPILYEYITDSITVLLSANKSCLPILGRQKHMGSLLTDTNTLPDGLKFLMRDYIKQINYCYTNRICDENRGCEWDRLASDTNVESLRIIWVVHPLLKTQWGQDKANYGYDPYAYNYYIWPNYNHGCDHCKAGCGTVAMAQVMNYWQHPIIRHDTSQFDWCNMPPKLVTQDYDYEKKKLSVANLIFVCAESITYAYDCDRTLSNTEDIRDALISFGYSNNAVYVQRGGNTSEWMAMIKDNLDNGYPIIYGGGVGSTRHTFVCDGYTIDDLFNFNWGSVTTDPGLFTLDNIAPANYNFTSNQEAIFKIHPVNQLNLCNADLYLDDFYHDNASMLNDYHPYEITPQTMTTLTSASSTSDASWRTIPTGATAIYQAHEKITLQDGFEAEYGSEFEARIEPCEQCDEMRGAEPSENDEFIANNGSSANEDNDEVLYSTGSPAPVVDLDLFPNPTDGPLTMHTDGEPQKVLIYTLDGRPVGGWHLTALGDDFVSLDVSSLRPGPYLLSVVTATSTRTARFIRH